MRHLSGSGGGSKGGGGETRGATEAADSLRSVSSARVIDLICEGTIKGFAAPDGQLLRNATFGVPVINTINQVRGASFVANRSGANNYLSSITIVDSGYGHTLRNQWVTLTMSGTYNTVSGIVAQGYLNNVGAFTATRFGIGGIYVSNGGQNYYIGQGTLFVSYPVPTDAVLVRASGSLVVSNNTLNNVQVVIDAKTYTFKNTLTPAEGEVHVGADMDASLLNLANAINHDGVFGTDYYCVSVHPSVTASTTVTAHAITITAITGIAIVGNAIITTSSGSPTWINGGTLTGGVSSNISGPITSISVIDGGAGYTGTSVTLTITGDGTGCTATGTVVDGAITAVVLGGGGGNYYTQASVTPPFIIGRAIYLDDIPVVNADMTANFPLVNMSYRLGTQDQEPLEDFPASETVIQVAKELRHSSPVSVVLTDPSADSVILAVSVPSLTTTDPTNGNVSGGTVQFQVYVRYSNESVTEDQHLLSFDPDPAVIKTTVTISGKVASGGYTKSVPFQLPKDITKNQHRWDFTIERLTADASSVYIQNKSFVEYLTARTNSPFRYPNSAIIGLQVDAQQFPRVPVRGYHVKMLVVSVPSNYFPETRKYNRGEIARSITSLTEDSGTATATCVGHCFKEGQSVVIAGATPSGYNGTHAIHFLTADSFTYTVSGPLADAAGTLTATNLISDGLTDAQGNPEEQPWDGTFYSAWTDNPAWCFYDLCTHDRYGLGQFLNGFYGSVDKWELYQIAQYCDELVPDGYGKTEPRYTCNVYLQTREDAYQVLTSMASIFGATLFWGSGTIIPLQDRPKEDVLQFTHANVVNGSFAYSGTSRKARHTVALVRWNDPGDLYKPKVEYVEDQEGILRYGVKEIELANPGCTSRGQAHRLGAKTLLVERSLKETIAFATGMEAILLRPGDTFTVLDHTRAGVQYSGRITAISDDWTAFTTDREVTLSGTGYNAYLTRAQGYYIPSDTELNTSELYGDQHPSFLLKKTLAFSFPDPATKSLVLNFSAGVFDTKTVASATKDDYTVTMTVTAHGFYSGQKIRLQGASPAVYNTVFEITVLTKDTFTFETSSDVAEPTGTITVQYCPIRVGAVWGLESNELKAKRFRCLSIVEKEDRITHEITGLEYIEGLYDAVEQGLYFERPTTTTLTTSSASLLPRPPVNLQAYQRRISAGDYKVVLTWEAPQNGLVTGYNIYYAKGIESASLYSTTAGTTLDVTGLTESDEYTFYVYSKGLGGNVSSAASIGLYVGDAPDSDLLDRITGLRVTANGVADCANDDVFYGPDVTFEWQLQNSGLTNGFTAASNNTPLAGVQTGTVTPDTTYEIKIIRPTDLLVDDVLQRAGTVIHTQTGLTTPSREITRSQNITYNGADDGSPLRDFIFQVAIRQGVNLSLLRRIRVTNPYLDLPTDVSFTSSGGSIFGIFPSNFEADPDFDHYAVWISDVPAFALTDTAYVATEGATTEFTHYRNSSNVSTPLVAGNFYYLRFAAVDTFAAWDYDALISTRRQIKVVA